MKSLHFRALLIALLLLPAMLRPLHAADCPAGRKAKPAADPPLAGVGKLETVKGTLLQRQAAGATWLVANPAQELHAGALLLGLPGAVVVSKNGAVALEFQTDFHSPLPVLECALALNQGTDSDLDFTLDRGRVDVTNRKKEGPAKVRLHAQGETWDLSLAEPKASLAIELYGLWPAGSRFVKDPGPKDRPHAEMLFLVLQGEVDVKFKGTQERLSAPPGNALTMWDNDFGMDKAPQFLKELPAWATRAGQQQSQEEQAKYQALREHLIRTAADKSFDAAVDELLASTEPIERRVGVILLGATDNLARLGQFFQETKHDDLLDTGILVLRHWIGRGPGADVKLYRGLIEKRGYKPIEAESMLQLLHGFNEEELAQPETYQLLITYLNDRRQGIRAIAYWHLIRLVPAGQDIAYSPLDPPEARQRGQKEWQKLVPPGHVPAKKKSPTENK
jgi:hypothetical protein